MDETAFYCKPQAQETKQGAEMLRLQVTDSQKDHEDKNIIG